MSSGAIPDTALSASSSFDEKSVGPLNSRYQYSSTFPFLVSSSDTAEMQDRFACMTCLELLHLVRNHMRTVSIRNIPIRAVPACGVLIIKSKFDICVVLS